MTARTSRFGVFRELAEEAREKLQEIEDAKPRQVIPGRKKPWQKARELAPAMNADEVRILAQLIRYVDNNKAQLGQMTGDEPNYNGLLAHCQTLKWAVKMIAGKREVLKDPELAKLREQLKGKETTIIRLKARLKEKEAAERKAKSL